MEQVVLLWGEDRYRRRQALEALLTAHLPDPDERAWGLVRTEGAVDWEVLHRALQAPALFGSRRVLWTQNLLTTLNPSDEGALRELRRALLPDALWLLEEETGPPAWARRALDPLEVREFPPLRGKALLDWIGEEARRRGLELASGVPEALVAALGEAPGLLVRELEKLALYVHPRRRIERADLEAVTPVRLEGNIFALVDALGAGDGATALRQLARLLGEGAHPAYLLYMVARQLRLLLLAREALERGASPEEAARTLGVPPFVARKLLRQVRPLSLARLIQAHRALARADFALKTGRRDPQALVEGVVAGLALSLGGGRRGG